MPRPNRTIAWTARSAAVLGASVTLAACGSHSHGHTTRTTSSTPSHSTTTTTSTTTAATPIATAAWSLPAASPTRVQVSIYDLRRDGPYLVLDFGVRCETSNGCEQANLLATDAHDDRSTASFAHQTETPSGIALIDPTHAEEYRVAQDSSGYAFASALQSPDLTAGQTYLGWARYALPPSSVTALDVALPSGGPVFSGVPVSSGGHSPVAAAGQVAAQTLAGAPSMNPDSTTGMTMAVNQLTLTAGTDRQYVTNTATTSEIALRGDVLFHFDKSDLTPQAHAILASVAAQIKARARGTIQVTGYTDAIGSQAFNLGLSQRRAQSVVTALRALTPGVTYTAAGMGKNDPVASNATPAGRALNRRVTVSFAVKLPPKPTVSTAQTGPAGSGSIVYTTNERTRFRIAVASTRREGLMLLAELDVTCLSHGGCLPGTALGAGTNTVPVQPDAAGFFGASTGYQYGDNPAYDSVNGFSLLDPRSATVYLAALAGDVPVTSTFNAGAQLPEGETFPMWTYYAAPPATTTQMQLIAPQSSGGIVVHSSGVARIDLSAG